MPTARVTALGAGRLGPRVYTARRAARGPGAGREGRPVAPAAAAGARRGLRAAVAAAGGGNGTGSGAAAAAGEGGGGYRLPPPAIQRIVEEPSQPGMAFSPDKTQVLLTHQPPSLPPVSDLAMPELRIAGLRLDEAQNSRSKLGKTIRMSLASADKLLPPQDGSDLEITGYPDGMVVNYFAFSDDGRHIAFTLRPDRDGFRDGVARDVERAPLELWVADAATGRSRKLLDGLNTTFMTYSWVDDDTLVAAVIPEGRGPAPREALQPFGPTVQENLGGTKSQNRTYQDLLKNEHDNQLFEHYTTSEIIMIEGVSGGAPACRKIGQAPRMYTGVSPSPDGRYLVASYMKRPFSFTVPCGRFPKQVELWSRDGERLSVVADLPLAETIPIAHGSCRTGRRSLSFRPDQPATLYWVEAQDGGDGAREANPRDVVYMATCDELAAGAEPRPLLETELRYGGIGWGAADFAMLYESWYDTRQERTWTFNPQEARPQKQILFDRNSDDSYTDPGDPVSRKNEYGNYVMATFENNSKLLMTGTGATPEGNKPFLDLFDLETKTAERVWQSSADYYENLSSWIFNAPETGEVPLDGIQIMMTRETKKEPSQVYLLNFGNRAAWPRPKELSETTERLLTAFPHPYPTLKDLNKEVLRYERADGCSLTSTLYTPPGYDKARDGPLPTILWAYPKEFNSKEMAGQNRRTDNSFSPIGSYSPLLWLTQGYAVLQGATMPIIGEGDAKPNDSYVEQLVASAEAHVGHLVEMGVADPAAVAVGGHSYGAFMTANLLIHAPHLFACGIAQSGAYNRTLTPWGFQSEDRSLWEAPAVYDRMSPFMNADKLKKPILLVHGEADNNPGTLTMQSERLYSALTGHGAECKLVILPHESHGYRARESILHLLYETGEWLNRYMPGKPIGAAPKEEAEVVASKL